MYHVGQVVYEKKHGERNKLKPRYKKQVVMDVMPDKILINSRNRIIHKYINYNIGQFRNN